MSFFPLRIHQNRCRLGAGLRSRPHVTALCKCSPRPPSWFQGSASRQEGNGGEGREGLGGGEERKEESRGNMEGRGKGEVGGYRLGCWGIDAPDRKCRTLRRYSRGVH